MKMRMLRFSVALSTIVGVALLPACARTASLAVSLSSTVTPAVSTTASVSSYDFVGAVQKVLPSITAISVQYGPQGAPGQPSASSGAGTGWIVGANGLIVTNDHVVAGAQTISVALADGRQLPVVSVQHDSAHDLAVLKINAQNLPVATIGDSSRLNQGQPVAAVGNALDLGIRVTAGIVSLLHVSVPFPNGVTLTGLIETDAPINPGNSGGVLIDLSGSVVGITNSGLDDPRLDVENFGYAIAINDAMPVVNSLITKMPP